MAVHRKHSVSSYSMHMFCMQTVLGSVRTKGMFRCCFWLPGAHSLVREIFKGTICWYYMMPCTPFGGLTEIFLHPSSIYCNEVFLLDSSHYCNWATISQELDITFKRSVLITVTLQRKHKRFWAEACIGPVLCCSYSQRELPLKIRLFLGQTIAVGVTESQTQSQRPGVPVCWEVRQSSARNTKNIGTFLAIQWLRIHASTAVGTGSIPAWRTKIQHAVWCGQKIKARNTKIINLSSPLC